MEAGGSCRVHFGGGSFRGGAATARGRALAGRHGNPPSAQGGPVPFRGPQLSSGEGKATGAAISVPRRSSGSGPPTVSVRGERKGKKTGVGRWKRGGPGLDWSVLRLCAPCPSSSQHSVLLTSYYLIFPQDCNLGTISLDDTGRVPDSLAKHHCCSGPKCRRAIEILSVDFIRCNLDSTLRELDQMSFFSSLIVAMFEYVPPSSRSLFVSVTVYLRIDGSLTCAETFSPMPLPIALPGRLF